MRKLVLVASFAIALLGGLGPALAATVNITFTGTTVNAGNGYILGAPVSGSMEMTLPDPPIVGTSSGVTDVLYQGTGTFTLDSSPAVSGSAEIFNRGGPGGPGGFGALLFTVGPLQLLFESFGGVPAPLTTLIDFPNKASVFAYLAGSMVANERSSMSNGSGFSFHIDTFSLSVAPVGTVPIPAALPLLASALGGLGFLGWKRRRTA